MAWAADAARCRADLPGGNFGSLAWNSARLTPPLPSLSRPLKALACIWARQASMFGGERPFPEEICTTTILRWRDAGRWAGGVRRTRSAAGSGRAN